MRTSAELREGYLAYFEEKGHKRLPSWPLIPRADDHSTLLTTAGMQPQMPYFLGCERPPAPLTTLSQKCFRTLDIDEVGLDGHHLTFFEMLGNFSFGQYFKEGAIELATEFVRERLQLDWDRVWVTVHAGDPELGLGEDTVAIDLWERIGTPRERIVALPSSENFWWVGGPGPCGPDSEIYWDWGPEHGCGDPGCAPACPRCDRFLEFWNLVFMAYELKPDGTLEPLPKENVDTGLGLERTAAIVQDVRSVYETDAYQAIMRWIAETSGVGFGDSPEATKAHRVLADHGRGMTFLVGDGVTPANEGRGYVLRRIIRRAIQHGYRIGLESPFLPRLADAVVDEMGGAYPELEEHRARIHGVLSGEEERFAETLSRGMRLFEDVAARGEIHARDAFDLTATYGFPFELTKELARERGLEVNEEEFTSLMEEHREISRAGSGRGGARAAEFARAAGFESEFVGWEKTDALTQIGALEALENSLFLCKLRESPFYAEGGGQVTDQGFLEHEESGVRASLREAFRLGDDQVLVFEGEGFEAGDRVRAVVSWSARFPTMANHTATHLLHRALRDVLGDHVQQAGSAVRPDKLRFDFTHDQPLAPEQRDEVERRVNEQIFHNHPVRTFWTTLDEAQRLGATMLFGEKYGDRVRVVEVEDYSRELCGGTHVRSTAEIGPFVLLSESSVGAGARRVEAITAGEAWAYLRAQAGELGELRAELERVRREAKGARPAAREETELRDVRERDVGGVRVLVGELEGAGADEVLAASDREKGRRSPAAVVLGAREDGKVHLVANFDSDVAARVSASDVVRGAAAIVGGGGGGRPTMARAGGRDPERLPEALAEAERLILAALGE